MDHENMLESLRAENAVLRQRVATLEQNLADAHAARVAAETARQRLHTIFMQSPVVLGILHGPQHIYELANLAYLDLVGKRDIVGDSIFTALPELAGQGFFEILDHVYRTGEPWYGNEVYVRLDRHNTGTLQEAWFNAIYQPTCDADGQVDSILVMAFEVTEQVRNRQHIERLNAELHTFRLVIEHTLDGIIFSDMQYCITYVNPAAVHMIGLPATEIIGQSSQTFIDPALRDQVVLDMEAQLQQTGYWMGHTLMRRADGTSWLAENSVIVLHDTQGTPVAQAVVVRDITRQVQHEQALRTSEERFRLLAEHARDIIYRYRLTPDPGLEYISPSFTAITGYSLEELYANPAVHTQIVHPDDLALVEAALADPAHMPHPLLMRLSGKDGTLIWTEQYVTIIRDNAGIPLAIEGVARDVTERQQMELALREREALFRSAFADAAVGMVLVNRDGRFVQVNEAFCRMIGYTEPELVMRSFLEITHPDDCAADQHYAAQMISGQITSYQMEKRYLHNAGHTIWGLLSVSSVSVTDAHDDVPTHFLAHIQDITARKHAEDALRESEALFRSVWEATSDALVLSDADGIVVAANAAYFRLYGYPPETVLGNTFAIIFPADQREVALASYKIVFAQQQAIPPVEAAILRNDGTECMVESRIDFVQLDAQRVWMLSAIRDITERKQSEQALRESEEKYRHLIENTGLPVGTCDYAGTILLLNSVAAQWLNGCPADFIGKRLHDVLWSETADRFLARVQRVIDTGQAEIVEEQMLRLEELIWVLLNFQPLRTTRGIIYAVQVIAHDISLQKQAETERLLFERKLQETQRLESLGVLAGGIAHDFNNLLVAILGNADLALLDLAPEAPARPSVTQISIAARRAADLTRQLLAYAGKGRFVVEAIQVNTLIEEMTHLLHTTIPCNVVLHYRLPPELPAIEADATQLRQIIMNLVVNAAEAIGTTSGVITITTSTIWIDPTYAAATRLAPNLAEGNYVFIEISDTGCGMDQATQARIFDPFFTTKFTGRGLGLAAVQGIVRGHQGAIKVYSEPGRGSTFKVFLPCSDSPAAPRMAFPPQSPVWRGSGTVLLIDDEPDVRTVATRMLERIGFTVLIAVDGQNGIEVFRAHASQIVCVLLDMTMPHLDGETVFRMIRQIKPTIQVILMSGYNEQTIITRFTGKGLAGFLQKPFTPGDLQAVLEQALTRAET